MPEVNATVSLRWWHIVGTTSKPFYEVMSDVLEYFANELKYRGVISCIPDENGVAQWSLEFTAPEVGATANNAFKNQVVVLLGGVVKIMSPDEFTATYPGVSL